MPLLCNSESDPSSVIDILQRKNLSHLGNQPELYSYGHPSLDLIDNRQILLSTIKYVKYTTRFSPSPPPPLSHTLSSPGTIVFDLFYLLLYSWFFLLYFCKFLGCHGFGLFSLPSHGTCLFFSRKENT